MIRPIKGCCQEEYGTTGAPCLPHQGRFVRPNSSRRRSAAPASSGGRRYVAVVETPKGLQVKTHAKVIREMQDYFCSFGPPDAVWSEELLSERRAENERD